MNFKNVNKKPSAGTYWSAISNPFLYYKIFRFFKKYHEFKDKFKISANLARKWRTKYLYKQIIPINSVALEAMHSFQSLPQKT
jgi:hypothetical protein